MIGRIMKHLLNAFIAVFAFALTSYVVTAKEPVNKSTQDAPIPTKTTIAPITAELLKPEAAIDKAISTPAKEQPAVPAVPTLEKKTVEKNNSEVEKAIAMPVKKKKHKRKARHRRNRG